MTPCPRRHFESWLARLEAISDGPRNMVLPVNSGEWFQIERPKPSAVTCVCEPFLGFL